MHELSITENILEISIRHGENAGAVKVTDIYLVIGSLSSIIDDSVQFYWDIVSENTMCFGAQLHFQRLPAELKCLDCDHTFLLSNQLDPCPNCGGLHIKVISGEQFYVESIAIEK